MHWVSPPENIHARDLEGLRKPDITFWTIWDEGIVAGCRALKELDPQHAEIKSMRTTFSHRRKDVAKLRLHHLLKEAKQRKYTRVSLKTGSMEFLSPRVRYTQVLALSIVDPSQTILTTLIVSL